MWYNNNVEREQMCSTMTEREEKPMNIIVFDTETAGCCTQTLLNIGYCIADVDLTTFKYRILKGRDYLIGKHYKNRLWLLNDMFVKAEKLAKFDYNVERGSAILRTEKQIFEQMSRDIAKYGVEYGFAYNSDFDEDKFRKTATELGIHNPLDDIKVLDIWCNAQMYICDTAEYLAFCNENELRTLSGKYIPTSVEGVTAFLNCDKDFVEEHTALSDVQWELRILCELGARGCNVFEQPKRNGCLTPEGEWVYPFHKRKEVED